MDFSIGLSPDVGIDPEEFVEEWNSAPSCVSLAKAHLEHPAGGHVFGMFSSSLVVLKKLADDTDMDALQEMIGETIRSVLKGKPDEMHLKKSLVYGETTLKNGKPMLLVMVH